MSASFDHTELMERVDQDMGFLTETVEMLAGDGRALLGQVRAALASNDAKGVGTAAHALKGMISNFCAAVAYERALAVERMGKAGNLEGAGPAVDDLGTHLETLIRDLEHFVRSKA